MPYDKVTRLRLQHCRRSKEKNNRQQCGPRAQGEELGDGVGEEVAEVVRHEFEVPSGFDLNPIRLEFFHTEGRHRGRCSDTARVSQTSPVEVVASRGLHEPRHARRVGEQRILQPELDERRCGPFDCRVFDDTPSTSIRSTPRTRAIRSGVIASADVCLYRSTIVSWFRRMWYTSLATVSVLAL